jgi:hypothetical protein
MSCKSHDNCYCGLNVHKRYDKPLAKQQILPHYPKQIKTVYAKDYIPLESSQPGSARTVEKRLMSMNHFADIPTTRKSKCLPATYATSYKKEFYPKQPRDTANDAK